MNSLLSARAQSDLDRIFAHIYLRQSPMAADRFLELAKEAAGFIGQHPLAGSHPSWATRHKTLRFWVISRTKYLIFYLAEDQEVSIERVLDGRRDVTRIMEFGVEEPMGEG
jgi:plasmid stabilization system protein ParE